MFCKRLCLCLPPVLLCVLDGCMTLCGQPPDYWTSGYTIFREANPVAAWLLTVHPLAFATAGVPYSLMIIGTIFWLPLRYSTVVAGFVSLAHAVGVLTWTVVLLQESPGLWVFLIPACVAALGCISWLGSRSTNY